MSSSRFVGNSGEPVVEPKETSSRKVDRRTPVLAKLRNAVVVVEGLDDY